MKTTTRFLRLIPVILSTILISIGCSTTKSVVSDDSVYLKYIYSEGSRYSYVQNSTMTQTIIYMGQEMGSTVNSTLGITVFRDGFEDNQLNLKVTIDTLGISVKSMQGSFSGEIGDIEGKQFSFKLSESGEESNLQEATNLKYSIAGQETNMKPLFLLFFPDMPEESVKAGYTWNDADTVDVSSGSESATMIINSINTIIGKESINGYDCFVIKTSFTGVRDSGSDTPQGYISTTGNLTGEGTAYFSPAQGIFVRDYTRVKVDGSVNIPTGESLPLIIESEYTTELIGK